MKISLCTLILFPILSCAQTNYYSVDPVTGYKTKVGYSEPLNTARPIQFSPYVSQYNVDLYGKIIIDRQAQHDKNVASIQKLFNEIINLVNYLADEKHIDAAWKLRYEMNLYTKSLERSRPDYGNRNTYLEIFNHLENFGKDANQILNKL